MGMIEDVVAYLDSGSTGIAAGTDLFAHTLPETTGVAVGVFEREGPAPVRSFGAGSTPMQRGLVQVLVRSTAPANGESVAVPTAARALADTCWSRLEGIANTTLSGSTYLRAEPTSSPYALTRDEAGRIVFGFSAIVWRGA